MSARATRMDLEGELTIVTAAAQYERLRSGLAAGGDLVLDLAGITDLDTAGLQLLLVARREADHAGITVSLSDPSQAVRDVLAIARLEAELLADAVPLVSDGLGDALAEPAADESAPATPLAPNPAEAETVIDDERVVERLDDDSEA